MSKHSIHERHMRLALREAAKGLGKTSPNPAVGAILVKGGHILSRGFHEKAGKPHAEIVALQKLRSPNAKGATLYVTLEPCSTHGRTPPCTEAILQAGIRHVVWGATDPNPKHAGRAKKILEAAGIQVTTGVLEAECSALNEAWNHWIRTGMPFVIAKAGMSLDGRIATPPGASRMITCAESRKDAMALRSQVDAILIGAETLRVDNPALTVRGIPGAKQPLRIILTRSGKLPRKAKVFTDRFRDRTVIYKSGTLRSVLKKLGSQGVVSVLIEGGGEIFGQAFDAALVQKVHIYTAPVLLGGPVPAVGGRGVNSNAQAIRLANISYKRIRDDIRIVGYPVYTSLKSSK
ncbi:MAG: bifunctional diaminohydroxyphosphoribosylaminopyrimidine deaminase/5-amino-6-(5-phosphoribosylamino)uracil reductase RibD [Chthoniobacterales bacterium]